MTQTPEQWLLGQLLMNRMEVQPLKGLVWVEWKHEFIYHAMYSLAERNEPIDMLTVTEELNELNHLRPIGGAVYVAELADMA